MKKIIITATLTFIVSSLGWNIYFGVKQAFLKLYLMDLKAVTRMALIQIDNDLNSDNKDLGKRKFDLLLQEWQKFESERNYKVNSMNDILNKLGELDERHKKPEQNDSTIADAP